MKFLFIIGLAVLIASSCNPKDKKPDLSRWLITPEIILKKKEELNLSPAQLEAIQSRYLLARPVYDSLKLKMEKLTFELEEVVSQHPVEETRSENLLLQLLTAEHQVKTLQFKVYVFSKNQLTADQFNQLRHSDK